MFSPMVETVHEAVGAFDDAESLQAAMDDLQINGFMRQEISVLADDKAIEEKIGHLYKRSEDAADDPDAARDIFLPNETLGEAEGIAIGMPLYVAAIAASGFVVASGGSLIAAMVAALLAGAIGAAFGSIFAAHIARSHDKYVQNQIDRGGLLLWVHLRSIKLEKRALEILRKHAAHDVHIHEIPLH